jgi:hypothetical protein
MASTLEQEVSALQRTRGEEEAFNALGGCRPIAWINGGTGVAGRRREQLAEWA